MTNRTDPDTDRPRVLIEDWLPITELGIESRREAAPIPGQFPKLKTLHVWWARRPLAASAGVILASVLPTWTPELADEFADDPRLATQLAYRTWVLRLAGVWGDPIAAKAAQEAAIEAGKRIPNPYSYKQAFKNTPNPGDLDLLHRVLEHTWGGLPAVIDPTAGGGSIPYEAARYGLPTRANDLNAVAASVLRAGVETTARYGTDLTDDLKKWGGVLTDRTRERLEAFFPSGEDEQVATFLFARTVACPRTGKPVPLAPNWWISKAKADEIAVELVAHRDGRELDGPEFDIVVGVDAIAADPDTGTMTGGSGKSPWDGQVIEGDYIKAEAQAGRMGSVLYAVAVRVPTVTATGRTKMVRTFRAPTQIDFDALAAAETELARHLPDWLADGVVPDEIRYLGPADRSANYGALRHVDLFSPRQLLVHGTFAEEFQRLIPEVTDALGEERATALLALLGLMQGKALNFDAILASWHASRSTMRSVFERHDFAFKWTYAEFEGARELWPWCLEQLVDAYEGIAELLAPGREAWTMAGRTFAGSLSDLRYPVPGPVTVTRGPAGDLAGVESGSQTLVCIDPPYYDNVMYGELSDFFGVWEQHTVGRVWPDLLADGVADIKNEAVANPSRFAEFGRRRKELANADYEAKMAAIFAECARVLRLDGVMTVMFTHKRAEAWDTLGVGLLDAGFTVESSWPVNTESEQSLHQAKKNAAASTIMLACRKRLDPDGDGGKVFFEDIEPEVRAAAREATTRFEDAGIGGVDLLLASYGPALSVLSRHWPVYSSETDELGGSRRLRPEEALEVAREEVARLRRLALVGHPVDFDPVTDFVLIAWDIFRAEEFPYDEARHLALALGGGDVESLAAAKVLAKKTGTVRLLSPVERRRRVYRSVADGEVAGMPLIDVLHGVMVEADSSGLAAAKGLCDRLGLMGDARFQSLIQAMVRAVPSTKVKGKWVRPEAEFLNGFATAYLPDVELPVEEPSGTLFDT